MFKQDSPQRWCSLKIGITAALTVIAAATLILALAFSARAYINLVSPASSMPSSSPASSRPSTNPPVSASSAPTTSASADTSGQEKEKIASEVSRIEQSRGARIQVSWLEGGQIQTAGSLQDLPAWSTSKVPVAMAIYAQGKADANSGNISAAIRASDNAAAEALWQGLGGSDAQRAQAVTAILRQAGDSRTTVPSTRLRSGFTIFGQTQWNTTDQLQFLQNFNSLPGAAQLKSHMYAAYGNQRWGIGRLPNSAVKGGWGPTLSGGYTARQIGWFQSEGKETPIAIAAQASSFGAATAVVDEVAKLFY
ncbi:hypothetical protein [uncultured Varibaculum sp.]|uniref:hypothetical protein n=1 Tax=uncultured Varibaculum sp. TaxID=413896 RepID=UPI0025888A55|nr:hypothetical protein [uncultured Varibaculum sp.]